MTDLPWFPFWVKDFLASRKVQSMTAEEVGVYLLMLFHEWDGGPLPNDLEEVSALCHHADRTVVQRMFERCFELGENGWTNSRLEQIRDDQKARRVQQSEAGKASGVVRGSYSHNRSNARSTHVQRTFNKTRTDGEQPLNQSESEVKESPSGKRKHGLPEGWKPNASHGVRCEAMHLDIAKESEAFEDFHVSKGSTFTDWDRAFNTWLRNAEKFGKNGNGKQQPKPEGRKIMVEDYEEGGMFYQEPARDSKAWRDKYGG